MLPIKKIALTRDGHKYYIKDTSQDLHTQFGVISHTDFGKHETQTNKGKKVSIVKASFIDKYDKIKRGPQIVPRKDLGAIIVKTGMNKSSIVVDAGSGSGGASLAFSNTAKQVYSFDIREDFHNVVKHNKEFMEIKNIEYSLHDVTTGIPIKNVDIIFLDLPTPWLVVKHAEQSLKRGGFLVSYSPTIPQVMDFVKELKISGAFSPHETIEITEREWDVEERKVRPKKPEYWTFWVHDFHKIYRLRLVNNILEG